jgi:hypothetical protein
MPDITVDFDKLDTYMDMFYPGWQDSEGGTAQRISGHITILLGRKTSRDYEADIAPFLRWAYRRHDSGMTFEVSISRNRNEPECNLNDLFLGRSDRWKKHLNREITHVVLTEFVVVPVLCAGHTFQTIQNPILRIDFAKDLSNTGRTYYAEDHSHLSAERQTVLRELGVMQQHPISCIYRLPRFMIYCYRGCSNCYEGS